MGTAICVSCTQSGSIISSKLTSVLKVYQIMLLKTRGWIPNH
jgi:hypothetical protein